MQESIPNVTFAWMRILAYILSLYILILSAVPCWAIDSCNDEASQTERVPPNHKEDCCNCSPFFTCGNCSGFVQMVKPLELHVPDTQKLAHHERIISLMTSSYIPWFLQPPRMD